METTTIDDTLKMPLDAKQRGKVLKKRREFLGLSQSDVAKEIAKRLGLPSFDYKRISAWENGRNKNIPEDIKLQWYGILELNEFEELVFELQNASDIYTSLTVEFKAYVAKQINKNSQMALQKELTSDVCWNLQGMLAEFLQKKFRSNNF